MLKEKSIKTMNNYSNVILKAWLAFEVSLIKIDLKLIIIFIYFKIHFIYFFIILFINIRYNLKICIFLISFNK